MSTNMQIAFSVSAGVALIGLALLLRMLRDREALGPRDVAFALPGVAFIAFSVFGDIHQGGLPRGARMIRDGAFLALGIAALISAVRVLRTFWHDEDELAELFGSSEGYIPRRQVIPLRYKALLTVLLFVGLVTAFTIYYFMSLFALEF